MESRSENKSVKVAVLESTLEAQLIETILNEQNIPHQMRSYHDTAFDGLFQVQKGWGSIYAPLTYKQRILEIIDDIRSGDDE